MTVKEKTKRVKRPAKKARRPLGLAKGKVKLTKAFFKPLSDKLLSAFEGI
jgi:hypothetical protein